MNPNHGQSDEGQDELNCYWGYPVNASSRNPGLRPHQILNLRLISEPFNPVEFATHPGLPTVVRAGGLPAATAGSSDGAAGLKL